MKLRWHPYFVDALATMDPRGATEGALCHGPTNVQCRPICACARMQPRVFGCCLMARMRAVYMRRPTTYTQHGTHMRHTFLRRKQLPRARFRVLDQNVWHGSFQLRIRALCGSQRTGFAGRQLIQQSAPALAHESGAQTRHTRAGTLARKQPHAFERCPYVHWPTSTAKSRDGCEESAPR